MALNKQSQSLLNQARAARQNNLNDLAISFYEQYLNKHKYADDIRYELATYYALNKKHKEAISIFKILIKTNSNNPFLFANLGTACAEANFEEEAIGYFKKALELNKKLIELFAPMAECYRRLKKFELALDALKYLLNLQPKHHHAYGIMGLIYFETEELPKALECFERAIEIESNIPEYYMHFSRALIEAGFYEEAKIQIEIALKQRPGWVDATYQLIEVLKKSNKFFDAIDYLKVLLVSHPGNLKMHELICQFYLKVNDMSEATKHLDILMAKEPQNINIKILEIVFLEKNQQVEKANQLKNELIATHGRENKVMDYAMEEHLLCKIDSKIIQEKIINSKKLTIKNKVKLNFFLGDFYDAHKNWDEAFEYYSLGNKIKNEYYENYENDYFQDLDNKINRSFADYSQSNLHEIYKTDLDLRPIFIVGMSRSGKSWIENMLSMNSDIVPADEIKINFYKPLNILDVIHSSHPHQGPEFEDLSLVRARYLSEIEKYAAVKKAKYVVNTLPANAFYIGYIHRLFPEAPILYSQRDPKDIILFNFFKNYRHDMPYAYKLESIVRYYLLYQRVMNFWVEKLPNKIIQFRFEDSVKNPIESYGELLKALNIYSKDILDDSKAKLQIKANSYKTTIGHWKNYQKFLKDIVLLN